LRGVRAGLVGWAVARLARLRFPVLFLVAATLFAVDLVLPDVIPFADELLLGLATALLATLKRKLEGDPVGPPVETPPRAVNRGAGP
jgi:hypothetical protein